MGQNALSHWKTKLALCVQFIALVKSIVDTTDWETGPLVNRMPVFHLLFAAGILATGMESAKALRLFSLLKVPNVKRRQLSNILKNSVIPAVYNVWRKEQSARLKEIEGKPIVVVSDMRVYSPGHTGLFGSGSTLDMERNIILDTQIIKV